MIVRPPSSNRERTPAEYEGFGWSKAVHPEDAQPTIDAWNAAVTAKGHFDFEHRVRRHDGEWRHFSVRAAPTFDEEKRIIGWVGVHTDITERKDHEELRELLVRELDHRVKNRFVVVGGVVTLSARSAATPQEMATTVQGRLGALASAHVLIRHNANKGSGLVVARQTTVRELVETILAPCTDLASTGRPKPAIIDGPDVAIGGEAVTSLALVLHELATNAAKYGAFSTPDGHLRISWQVNKNELAVTWEERGGPTIDAAPQRQGFESLLARRSVNGQLGGELEFDWEPEGLIVRLTTKLERLVA